MNICSRGFLFKCLENAQKHKLERKLFCSKSTSNSEEGTQRRQPVRSRSQLFQYRKSWDINQLRAVLSDAPTLTDIINREKSIPFLAATNYKEFSQLAPQYL